MLKFDKIWKLFVWVVFIAAEPELCEETYYNKLLQWTEKFRVEIEPQYVWKMESRDTYHLQDA